MTSSALRCPICGGKPTIVWVPPSRQTRVRFWSCSGGRCKAETERRAERWRDATGKVLVMLRFADVKGAT